MLKPVGALLAAWLLGACSAPPAAAPADVPVAPAQSPAAETPASEPVRMTPQEAQARISQGEAILIVDVRSKAAYDAEHLPGAVSHTWADLRAGHDLPPKDKLLLLYCT